jgi:hypothetical protein
MAAGGEASRADAPPRRSTGTIERADKTKDRVAGRPDLL